MTSRPRERSWTTHSSKRNEAKTIAASLPRGWYAIAKRYERWKARYPEAAARLQVDDVLVDSMRGRSTNWTRIRINLRNVPEGERPPEDPPEPDYDPWPAAAHG